MIPAGLLIVMTLIIISLIIFLTWRNPPEAKFINISRADKDTKDTFIGDMTVYDHEGEKATIIKVVYNPPAAPDGTTTNGSIGKLFSSTSATAADVVVDGTTQGYALPTATTGTGTGTASTTKKGPMLAGLLGVAAGSGTSYMQFVLGCPTRLSKIELTCVDDDVLKSNMGNVQIRLYDKEYREITEAVTTIPVIMSPKLIHHITYT
jgi:hypothetical protein